MQSHDLCVKLSTQPCFYQTRDSKLMALFFPINTETQTTKHIIYGKKYKYSYSQKNHR